MVANKKLALAERKRQHALMRAEKANADVLELNVRNVLSQNPEFKRLDQELVKLRGDIHITRLNITKKSSGLVTRKAAIERIEKALEKHKVNEKLYVKQLDEVAKKLDTLRQRVVAQVQKELGLPNQAPDHRASA